jgi:methionyl-tRNA formyltransferase
MITGPSNDSFPSNPRLVFMGTPEFALPALEALIGHGYEIVAAVTQPDRPKGRGRKIVAPPVKKLAAEHKIEVLQPERAADDNFCDLIRGKAPDLIIVVAFGQILRKNLLSIPKWGIINIHASLLPKYRGAAPIQWAILNQESMTGLTIIRLDEGLDAGPILFQAELQILEGETAGQLHDRLALMAGEVIIKALNDLAADQLREIPQDHSLATYAPKIDRDLSLIDWTQPATRISALIRGLDPRPGAYTLFQGKEIKMFSPGAIEEPHSGGVPGEVVRKRAGEEGLCVKTGKGLIEIKEIQYPGKKRVSASEFMRGFPLPDGTIFGK